MSVRFDGMACVLCGSPSSRVGEHVWPRWLLREFLGEGPFTTEKAGVPLTGRDGETVVTHTAVFGTHVPMCNPCNGRLNTLVEGPAKSIVRRVLPKSAAHQWPVLTRQEAADLGRWFLKIGLLLSHPAAHHDNPHVATDADRKPATTFHEQWLEWMRTGTDPAPGFSVYAVRRAAGGDVPWVGDQQRIFLPSSVAVDGAVLPFWTYSLGIRGLDVEAVFHPGWPIRHPLIESGRAAQLWPSLGTVDLGALPEVDPREFSFVAGAGRLSCTAKNYNKIACQPLQVGLLPSLVAANVGAIEVESDA